MKISIEFAAQLKQAAGYSKTEYDAKQGESLEDIIISLAQQQGAPLSGVLLTTDQRIQPALLCFINDQQVTNLAEQTPAEGSTLTIMSPISGG